MEVYLGANGIIDHFLAQQADPAMPCTEDQIACVKYILAEAEKNNPRAIHTIDETIRYLGISIANMINVLNPEMLLLGGWLGMLLGSNFMERIEPIVSQYALQQSLVKTTIRVCQLAQDSVAKGAAAMLLNHFFETAGESESLLVGGRAISKTRRA
jgi:predicted NBD/HSP70 family sugar kinase